MKRKSVSDWLITKINVCLVAAGFLLVSVQAIAQEEKAGSEKSKAFITLTYKKTDGVKAIKVSAFTKAEKKKMPVEGSPVVSLYLNEVKKYDKKTGDGYMGKLALDQDGKADYELTGDAMSVGGGKHDFTFIAEMKGDEKYADKQGEVTVKDANITISVTGKDTAKTVTARLTEWKEDGTEAPVTGVEMKLAIRRTFSLLLFGGDLTTDKNGEVTAPLPNDIIGEANGTLVVVGKVDENETYGNIQGTKAIPWTILPKANAENKRNLWSTGRNAPYSLVLTSVVIICIIWGLIAYLVTLLFKINKIGKKKSIKNN